MAFVQIFLKGFNGFFCLYLEDSERETGNGVKVGEQHAAKVQLDQVEPGSAYSDH